MINTAVAASLVLLACAVPFVLTQLAPGQDIGDIDPTPFLRDRVFVRRQLTCVVGNGPCDFVGRYLQGVVDEVLTRNCRSCSPQQAANSRRIINFIRTNYPTEYYQIVNRYRSG